MAMDKSVLKTPRFILTVVELLFSFVVLITAAVFIDDASGYNNSNMNFALFVSIISILICAVYIALPLMGKSKDRVIIMIELITFGLWWIFWLSAAAATASTTSWVNSGWNSFYTKYYDNYLHINVDAVRACCAFSWLTWALWTASLVLIIMDVAKNKTFSMSQTGPPVVASDAPEPANIAPTVEKV